MLNGYTSADGHKYTASDYWLNAAYCNGFVTSANVPVTYASITSTYCGLNSGSGKEDDYGAVRTKAYALGVLAQQLAGSTVVDTTKASSNFALSTNTSGGVPTTTDPGDIMFQTDPSTPINLSTASQGRFIDFSVDAATNCANGSPPLLSFSMQNGTVSYPLTSQAINVCPAAGGQPSGGHVQGYVSNYLTPDSVLQTTAGKVYSNWVYPVSFGRFFGDTAQLVGTTNSSFSLILRNTSTGSSTGTGAGTAKGTANGNDGAIDNIRIVDVTPWLSKSFSPATQAVGLTSQLTLTVNNTSEDAAKNGWSFVDTLPAGLTIASPSQAAGGTCVANGTSVGLSAPGTITVSNGKLPAGQSSCTITLNVTSQTAGTYTNGPSNISQNVGIDKPSPATVTFNTGTVSWAKENSSGTLLAGSEWKLVGPSGSSVPSQTQTVADCVGADASACTGLDQDFRAGQFSIAGLAGGSYTLQETVAPPGYTLDPTVRSFSFPNTDTSNGGSSFRKDFGVIMNTALPTASVTLSKQVADASGNNAAPASGWTMGAALSGAPSGAAISPSGTQVTTSSNGSVPAPWTVTFPSATSTTGVTVSETQQPGYQFSSGSCKTTHSDNSTTSTTLTSVSQTLTGVKPGDAVACTFTNKQTAGHVTWTKVAQGGSTLLSGSEWSLSGPGVPSGTTVTDCVASPCATGAFTDQDPAAGQFNLSGLTWGDYTLTESKAPVGYVLDMTEKSFTVGMGAGQVGVPGPTSIGTFTNTQATVPVLPLTGGMSTDTFMLTGGGLLAAAGVGGWLRQRRSMRRRH